MSLIRQAVLLPRYVAYRSQQEATYLLNSTAAGSRLLRTFRWWTHSLPNLLFPSCLPDPHPVPPAPPPVILVPADWVRRRIAVWERKLDNALLFGHTMPTSAEVNYRRHYLNWMKEKPHAEAAWLPVAHIEHDAKTVHVAVYQHPFLHSRLWRNAVARVTRHRASLHAVEPPPVEFWTDWVHERDQEGRLHVRRPQMLPAPSSQDPDVAGGAFPDNKRESSSNGAAGSAAAAQDAAEAREALKQAWADVRTFDAPRLWSAVQPLLLADLQRRLATLRAAVREFMEGFSEGTAEVESGRVDVAGDAKAFWAHLVHTVPEYLKSDQQPEGLQRPAASRPPPSPAQYQGESERVLDDKVNDQKEK